MQANPQCLARILVVASATCLHVHAAQIGHGGGYAW
jgi:hypothetical protein